MSIAKPDQSRRSLVTLSANSRRLIMAADRAQFRGDAAKCIDLIDAFYASLECGQTCAHTTDIDFAEGALYRQMKDAISVLCNETAEYEEVMTA